MIALITQDSIFEAYKECYVLQDTDAQGTAGK